MKRVYLDQNKWIDLAAARTGHRRGNPYQDVLTFAQAGVERELLSFPLSATHYIETSHRRQWESRLNLATTMALLSRFHTIAPESLLVPSEIDRALKARFGAPEIVRGVQVFGVGADHAFNTDIVRYQVPEGIPIDPVVKLEVERWATSVKEWAALVGPSPEVEGELEGYDPDKHRDVGERWAAAQQNLRVVRKEAGWHRGERAELVARAQAIVDYNEPIGEALERAGLHWGHVYALEQEGMTALVEDIPLIHVESELARLRAVGAQQPLTPNDLNDISALTRAIVYCDVVVTENQWTALIKRAGLDERYGVVVLNDLRDLVALLV
jgi:hypothetical protein